MLFSGIDLHRHSIQICTVDTNGTVIEQRNMKSKKEFVVEYFNQWNCPHQAVVECTGNWYWLCDLLKSIDVHIMLAHAKYLKAISYAKVKTDAVDAHTLAQLLRMDYIPQAHQLDPQFRAMRDLLRQRMNMEHKRLNISNCMGSVLAQFNITITDAKFRSNDFAKRIHTLPIPEQYRMILELYHLQHQKILEHKKQIEAHISATLKPDPNMQLLFTIPGIGLITGAIIAMETGYINRFPNEKHYCSYARLVPGAKNSAGKRAHRSGSKDGNHYLKFAFTEAAIKAIRFYKPIRMFAQRIEQRSHKRIAQIVVAKELAKIVFYVLTKQQPFKSFKGITIEKHHDRLRALKPARITGSAKAWTLPKIGIRARTGETSGTM
jgi:transposase